MEQVRVFIEGVYIYALFGTILYKAAAGFKLKCVGDTAVGYPEDTPGYIVAEAEEAARNSSITRTSHIELKVHGEVVYRG